MSDMRNIERENKKKQLRSNIVPMPGNRTGSQTAAGQEARPGIVPELRQADALEARRENGQAIWPAGSRIQKNLTATR